MRPTLNGSNDFDVWQDHTADESDLLCTRKTFWSGELSEKTCYGEVKRAICNLNIYDLIEVALTKPGSECLFLNKFDLSVSASAVMCWKEHVLNSQQTHF